MYGTNRKKPAIQTAYLLFSRTVHPRTCGLHPLPLVLCISKLHCEPVLTVAPVSGKILQDLSRSLRSCKILVRARCKLESRLVPLLLEMTECVGIKAEVRVASRFWIDMIRIVVSLGSPHQTIQLLSIVQVTYKNRICACSEISPAEFVRATPR